jgi:RecB family exonuclease
VCALVSALWPLMETELHAVLKELIRLYGLAKQPNHAAAYKQLFRLALTQRELYGTGLLEHLTAEWEGQRAELDVASGRRARGLSL